MLSATHQKIRGIKTKTKIFSYKRRKVVVDKSVLMSVAISCQISFDFLSSSGWHSADQKEKGKAISVGLHNLGKSHFLFFSLVGKDLETIGE